MQAIGTRHPPYDRSGKCSMGQASHITGPRRCVRCNDDDINAYDDYDDDNDENKKSNWLLHRSTNCCQNSTIRSQLSSHQALLLTADWWWCLLWEKKHERNLYDIILTLKNLKATKTFMIWLLIKPVVMARLLHEVKRQIYFPSFVLFWRNLCVVRILWITLAEIVACVEVAGVQKLGSCPSDSVMPIFCPPLSMMIWCWWWWE